jgi:hypothetical protein
MASFLVTPSDALSRGFDAEQRVHFGDSLVERLQFEPGAIAGFAVPRRVTACAAAAVAFNEWCHLLPLSARGFSEYSPVRASSRASSSAFRSALAFW